MMEGYIMENNREKYLTRSRYEEVLSLNEPSGPEHAHKAYIVMRKFADTQGVPYGKVMVAYDEAMILNEIDDE